MMSQIRLTGPASFPNKNLQQVPPKFTLSAMKNSRLMSDSTHAVYHTTDVRIHAEGKKIESTFLIGGGL